MGGWEERQKEKGERPRQRETKREKGKEKSEGGWDGHTAFVVQI